MHILVTGGFGFIGSNFCQLAIDRGHELTIIDKMTYAADFENLSEKTRSSIQFINLDIVDGSVMNSELAKVKPLNWIVNFAAESHVDRSIQDGIPFVNSNILGVVNLLEFIKTNLSIKMLQVSTDEVFGSIEEGSWNEDFPLDPRSAYSTSKASAEMFCNSYRNTHGVEVVTTRCANNFGPRQSAEKFIPTVINSILTNSPIPIYGDGSNRREWIYVNDHCMAILRLIESDNLKHSKYNLGGIEKTNLEVVHSILELMDAKQDLITFVPDRLGHDFRYSVNDSRFKSEFGDYLSAEFEFQLAFTIDWYMQNQKWLTRSKEKIK